jgi:hypothetical protein
MTIIRTQGNATGHGFYRHLYFSPELGKGTVKIVHGDEHWWPVPQEDHCHINLLSDIQNGETQAELAAKGWRDHCFVTGDETQEVASAT